MRRLVLLVAWVALAVLLASGVALVGTRETVRAASPGTSDKIVFTSERDGGSDVYLMNSDGSGQTRLTYTAESESQPAISPDGTKIAFQRGAEDEIYIMNSDGSNQTRLTFSPGNDQAPDFSPDGTKIAFSSYRDGNTGSEIYVMNTDGSNQTRLTNKVANDADPDFSPDGTKIVFAGEVPGQIFGYDYRIHVMDADGSDLRVLTNGYDTEPSFSPDGGSIVFVSGVRNDQAEISLMAVDGSTQTNLTNNGFNDTGPTFSPDGTKVAFHSNRNGNLEIYTMNADGSSQTNLTNNGASDHNPAWGLVNNGPDQPPPPPWPTSKDACKNGGYKDFGFKNQGQCVAFVKKAADDDSDDDSEEDSDDD